VPDGESEIFLSEGLELASTEARAAGDLPVGQISGASSRPLPENVVYVNGSFTAKPAFQFETVGPGMSRGVLESQRFPFAWLRPGHSRLTRKLRIKVNKR